MVRTRSTALGPGRTRSRSEADVQRLPSKRVSTVVVEEPSVKRRRQPSAEQSDGHAGHRVAYIHVGEGGEADLEAQLKGADNLDIQILEEETLPDIDASDMIHGLDHTGTARDYVDERHVCSHLCPAGCQGHLRPNEIVIYESYKCNGKLRGRRRYKGRIIYSDSSSSSPSSAMSPLSSLPSVSVSMATTERPRRGIPRSLALLNQSTGHPYRRLNRGEARVQPVVRRADSPAVTRHINGATGFVTSRSAGLTPSSHDVTTTTSGPPTANSRGSNRRTTSNRANATLAVSKTDSSCASVRAGVDSRKRPASVLEVSKTAGHSSGCIENNNSFSISSVKPPARLQQLLHTPPPPRTERAKHAWDNENKSHNIFVKPDDPFTFHRHPVAQSTDCIRTRSFYETGIHAFEIDWPTRQRGTHAVVGVGTQEAPTRSEGYLSLVGNDEFSWGWDLGRKKAYHDSKSSSGSVYPSNANDTFQVPAKFLVVLDMDEGTLGFVVDKHYLGHAFEGLKGKRVHLMVSAVWGHCEITLNYLGGLQRKSMPLTQLCRQVITERTSLHTGCNANGFLGSCQFSDECIQQLHLPRVMHSFLQYKDNRSRLGYLKSQDLKERKKQETDADKNSA